MEEHDAGAGDEDPGPAPGGPPHPMDRVWRHPSELPAFERPTAGPSASAGARPHRFGLARSILVPVGAGAIGALVTVAVLAAAGVLDRGEPASVANRPKGSPRAATAIATMANRVAPAIVAVRVVGKSGARTGSGVCVRHAGQVLTSDRLVADATSIDVVTSDGKVESAKVIGRDPASDLALLSIEGDLEAADLASADSVRLGEAVYAVGADSSGTPWVSEGIVSSVDGRVATNGTTMSGLIESNALTEPAIAGGALLDSNGRVAGILMTPSAGHPAAVAVPIKFASQVAESLRANGRVDHGWLGIQAAATPRGDLVITALAKGGPSEKAGIKVGDLVVRVDSQSIATIDDLMATARRHWPGDRIRLVITRGRSDLTVSVRLSRMPRTNPPSATTSTTTAATTTAP